MAEARTRGGEPRLVLEHVETEGEFRSLMDRRTWRYFMHLKLKYAMMMTIIIAPESLLEAQDLPHTTILTPREPDPDPDPEEPREGSWKRPSQRS